MATEPTSPPALDALPVAPSRGDAPSVFRTRADAFVASLVSFRTQLAALTTWSSTTATQVYDNAVEASEAAAAALVSANATAWVSGASYTAGQQVWSPITFLTYRAKTTHSGVTTDPSADSTNWRLSVGDGYAPIADPAFTGAPTAPTPAADDNSTKLATTAYVDAIPRKTPIASAVVTSAVSEVVFELTGFSAYELVMVGVRPVDTSPVLGLQFGSGPSTFYNGASAYGHRRLINATTVLDEDDSLIYLHPSVSNAAAGGGARLDCTVVPSVDGSKNSHIFGTGSVNPGTVSAFDVVSFAGQLVQTSAPVSHLRIFFSSGNIAAGEFYLYPKAG